MCQTLIFLSLLFLEKARKTTQKSKDFSLRRTPKIPGKKGKNAQKSKEIPCNEKSKEIPKKSKERKLVKSKDDAKQARILFSPLSSPLIEGL